MRAADFRAAQARAMTERQLLDAILGTPRNPGIALALGWRGYHTHRSQHSPAGFPDLTLVRRGRLVFAELKRQAAKYQPTPEQEAWLEDLGEVAAAAVTQVEAANPDRWPGNLAADVLVRVYLWRPLDLLDGTIEAVLR